MADEFPYSDSQLIDPTQPSDGTLALDLDEAIRIGRRALNYMWDRSTIRHFRHVDLVPLVQSLSVQGDKILELDISETPHTLVQLTGGYAGQIIYLTVAASTTEVPGKAVILHHNGQYIALRDGQDFAMRPGDVVILRNVGGDIDAGVNGYWEEWAREVAGALVGLVSADGSRFAIKATPLGALQVEGL